MITSNLVNFFIEKERETTVFSPYTKYTERTRRLKAQIKAFASKNVMNKMYSYFMENSFPTLPEINLSREIATKK